MVIERGSTLVKTLRRRGEDGPLAIAGPATWGFYLIGDDGLVADPTTPTFSLTGTVTLEGTPVADGEEGDEVSFRREAADTLALPHRATYVHLLTLVDPAVNGVVVWVSGYASTRRGEL